MQSTLHEQFSVGSDHTAYPPRESSDYATSRGREP